MGKQPFFSVIIPCYNAEVYLPQAVDSVLKQQQKEWEVLLIDDGSTDSTPILCDDYSKQDSRIRVFHQPNGGVSKARNLGLQKARGTWVVFLDSDDWFTEDAFLIFEKSILKNVSEIHMFNHLQNKGKHISPNNHFASNLFVREGEEIKLFVLDTLFPYYDENEHGIRTGNIRAVHGKLYLRSLLINNHLCFDEKLSIAEDALFNFYAFQSAHSICLHDRYVMCYRINESSVMHKYNPSIDDINNNILNSFAMAIGQELDYEESFRVAYQGLVAECIFRSLKLNYLNPGNTDSYRKKKIQLRNYINSKQIRMVMHYPNLTSLPLGKKQMMWCFKHGLLDVGLLIGRISMAYLKYKGNI